MNNNKKIIVVTSMIAAIIGFASHANAAYRQPSNYGSLPQKKVNPGNSSDAIITLINNNSGGVVITLKTGIHNITKTIEMKKNVHIRFESGVTVNKKNEGTLFAVSGGNNSIVGPVQINGPTAGYGTKFKVASATCDNFLFKKLTINNNYTTYCTLNCTKGAKNGTVSNIKATKTPPGYGLIQMHAGENMLWKNLDCSDGGVCLRFEQSTEDKPWVGKTSGKAKNITCHNGKVAVLIAPTVHNGDLTINKVRTYDCAWAVQGGCKHGTGSYESVKVDDIIAVYGTAAVFKRMKYFVPDNLQDQVTDVPDNEGGDSGKFEQGPSLGAVNSSVSSYKFTNIQRTNFPSVYNNDPLIVFDDDLQTIADKR